MQLDIRYPMGFLFLVLGLCLIVYGLIADPTTPDGRHPPVNIDAWWGLFMAVFGAASVLLAFLSAKSSASPKE
jgi:drug/metabolite transporter (DMT)-like permease